MSRMSEPISVDQAQAELSELRGSMVTSVESIVGEIYLSFAPLSAALRLSAVHWLLTAEGRIVVSSFLDVRSKRLPERLLDAVRGRPVGGTDLTESLGLTVGFSHNVTLSTLPLADRARQARMGEVQWALEGRWRTLLASGWGQLSSSAITEPIAEPDLAEGRGPRERQLMMRLLHALQRLYGARVIADGRELRAPAGPDLIGVEANGERFAVELKLGEPRPEHLHQIERYMADERSPAHGARWILVAEWEPSPGLKDLAASIGVEWVGLHDLEVRAGISGS
jgi:hypothetical protein